MVLQGPVELAGFISAYDKGEFILPRWPLPRQTSCLRVVLSAEHLNAAHNRPRRRHHMLDRGRRIPVRAWVLSFSPRKNATTSSCEAAQFWTLSVL